jgi:hypothetical protein
MSSQHFWNFESSSLKSTKDKAQNSAPYAQAIELIWQGVLIWYIRRKFSSPTIELYIY